MMDSTPKTMTAKPKFDQAFQATTQNVSAQAKEASETMSRAAVQSTDLMKNCYATGLKGALEYNAKVMEFAKSNTDAVFGFAKKLSDVKSPSDFIELTTDYSRQQFETLSEQTKDLTALAQKVTLAAVAPLKAGVGKAFDHVS